MTDPRHRPRPAQAREGDTVEFRAPAGVEQLEVLEIRYGAADGETC